MSLDLCHVGPMRYDGPITQTEGKKMRVYNGMKEEDDEPLTISSQTLSLEGVERFAGTWYIAVVNRYGRVTFERRESPHGVTIEAVDDTNELVAFVIFPDAEVARNPGV